MRIVECPHPALLTPTVSVRTVDNELRRHVGTMFELMYRAGGVGLAANQVALPYRLVVMNTDTEHHAKDREQIFINPTIVEKRGQIEEDEGCLSFPGLYAKVRRAKEVVVEAYDTQGQMIRIDATGLEARAWQHELDHLAGKVFIERFATLTKLAQRSTIRAFETRFRRAQGEGRIPPSTDIEKSLAQLRLLMER